MIPPFKRIPPIPSTVIGLSVILFLLLCGPDASASILPEGLMISEQFRPGYGAPVGKVLLTQGSVVIVHQGIESGFRAEKGTPLFKGDILYTETRSRVRFRMNDGSIMTLSSQTKLTINQSIYNPQKKKRTSFVSLAIGKARFLVTKMFNFQNTSFKVKSGTFVAGVRGSDFVITQTGDRTSVATLEKTTLEVSRMDAPEMKPILLSSFQHTSGAPGGDLQKPQNLPPQEIELLKQDFSLPGDPGYSPDSETEEQKSDEKPAQGSMPTGDMPGPLPMDEMSDATEGLLISADELENPDFDTPEFDPPAEPPELPPVLEPEKPVEEPPEIPEVDTELPGLPGLPQ